MKIDLINQFPKIVNDQKNQVQQYLLKSIKTMKQNVMSFIERYNLNDESELSIIEVIMKACESTAMNELQTKTITMKHSVSTLFEVQKKLRQSASEEVNTILLKNDVYDKIMEFVALNVIPQEEADSSHVMNSIIELIKMKRMLEKLMKAKSVYTLSKVTQLFQFKKTVMQRLKANDSQDVESMIQRIGQFKEHEEEINKI